MSRPELGTIPGETTIQAEEDPIILVIHRPGGPRGRAENLQALSDRLLGRPNRFPKEVQRIEVRESEVLELLKRSDRGEKLTSLERSKLSGAIAFSMVNLQREDGRSYVEDAAAIE